jgi:hypothetical protein
MLKSELYRALRSEGVAETVRDGVALAFGNFR